MFSLTFGDEKAVEVVKPERTEFSKLYLAYDKLEEEYYAEIDRGRYY